MKKLTKLALAKEIVKEIVKTLTALGCEFYGEPSIKTEADGFDTVTVCWDGPCNWACLIGSGDSIFAEELGNYSYPQDAGLERLSELAKSNRLECQPETGYQLGIYG